MIDKQISIIMVGVFPPPIHGMAVINSSVFQLLKSAGNTPLVLNIAGENSNFGLLNRISRVPKVIRSIIKFACLRPQKNSKLYISISGGLGQFYEIIFIFLAIQKKMSVFLHHHSYAYIDSYKSYTQLLVNVAGSSSIHILLSERMSKLFKERYKAEKTVIISNAVFQYHRSKIKYESEKRIENIGFISNISASKGIFEYLDLIDLLQKEGLSLNGKIAGPFCNSRVKNAVWERIRKIKNVSYVGPKYHFEKFEFLDSIDVLVFPTKYSNEAEPLIIVEALSRGVPVIAFGRGSIPEVVNSKCGKVIETHADFVSEALVQIKAWQCDSKAYFETSRAASQNFLKIYNENCDRWAVLFNGLAGRRMPHRV